MALNTLELKIEGDLSVEQPCSIPVRLDASFRSTAKAGIFFCILDLQGDVHIDLPKGENGSHGPLVELTQLRLEHPDKASFTVGNKTLRGKLEKLARPLAVARLQRDKSEDRGVPQRAGEACLAIHGFVTHKLVFGTRPVYRWK